MNSCQHLIDIIKRNAANRPYIIAYQWLDRGEYKGSSLTFSELFQRVQRIAAAVGQRMDRNVEPRKIILMFEPSLDFISALFGCMAARHIAVPVSQIKPNANIQKLKNIVEDCGVDLLLTSDRYKATAQEIVADLGLRELTIKSLSELLNSQSEYVETDILPSDTAFYQYTSGSTGQPKGVEITHQNIMANQAMIQEGFCHDSSTIFVGWLPLYHDMGLIGNVMQPMYLGISCYLMSPLSFVQKPVRWLKAIAKYGATTSGGPNFGYDLCVNRIDEQYCEGLDLSSWKVAYNGSEPVRAETLQAFSKKFAPYGFNHRAHYPCYGMAESTLFITGAGVDNMPRFTTFNKESLTGQTVMASAVEDEQSTTSLVSCGIASMGQEVVIVDPNTLVELKECRIGEIWVKGENIAKSYVNKPALTQEVLYAQVADKRAEHYLRTGDLGFIYQGELYITGRIKDLIIIRGKNYCPHDIERSVSSIAPEFDQLSAAAIFDEENNKGRLVVLQEVSRKYIANVNVARLSEIAKFVVNTDHDIALNEILLLKPNSIPKTTSGKIQRSECLRRYRNREFQDRLIVGQIH